jgi:hypothetical protein
MALGAVKHKAKKVGRAAQKSSRPGGNTMEFHVRVRVMRSYHSNAVGAKGDFQAYACVADKPPKMYGKNRASSAGTRHAYDRCSNNFGGNSPTAAAKKALRDLAKILK